MTDEIQYIIIASLEGSATDNELVRLHCWLDESAENIALYEDFCKLWRQAGKDARYDVDRGWMQIGLRLKKNVLRHRKRLLVHWMEAAAVITFFIAGGIWYWGDPSFDNVEGQIAVSQIEPGSKKAILYLGENRQVELNEGRQDTILYENTAFKQEGNTLVYNGKNQNAEIEEYNRLVTPRGGEYSVVLSDGTKVWLNAESELKYPVHFKGPERKVYLKGEAYFDVAKCKGQKFVVCSDKTQITVLGTEFNIKNYEGGVVAATLVAGSVLVGYEDNECRLKPGQQAVVSVDGVNVREVETILYTAWKDGFFVYQDMTLDQILQELSRWYDFTYFYQNEELGALRLTAKLRKFDSVEDIFEILKTTGQVDFVVKGRTVTVMK